MLESARRLITVLRPATFAATSHAILPAIFAASLFLPSVARAECVETTRKIDYSAEESTSVVSYLCSTDPSRSSPDLKIEFHRFSSVAAALVVGGVRSKLLSQTVGEPRLIDNDVGATYARLLARYGEIHNLTCPKTAQDCDVQNIIARAAGGYALEGPPADKLRTFLTSTSAVIDYPNLAEVQLLRSKRVPPAMKFFYEAACDDDPGPVGYRTTECRKVRGIDIAFWRSMGAADADNYQRDLAAYNRIISAGGKQYRNGVGVTEGGANYLKLLNEIAGKTWPEDFAVLSGGYFPDGCGSGQQGLHGWIFQLYPRDVALEAMVITNTSQRAMTVDALLGRTVGVQTLREAADRPQNPEELAPLAMTAQTLQAGKSILIPTRIVLPPSDMLKSRFSSPRAGQAALRRLGTSGFQIDRAKYGVPKFRSYAYGPEIAVGGLTIDGRRIDWSRRTSNFTDMTVSAEAGSCPYLLAYDAGAGDWVNHGKVLHKAPDKERAYTETRDLDGFVGRFRLEEREPEAAHIDQVELTVTLRSGETLALKPDDAVLAARDGNDLPLFWGEATEITFALPEAIAADDVVHSRIAVTGYYRRYSDLMAGASRGPSPARLMPSKAAAISNASLCPVPPRRSLSIGRM